MSVGKANGQIPAATKVVFFRSAVRGLKGETIGKVDDTHADWSWTHGGGMLEVRYYGSSSAKREAMEAIDKQGQCAVPILMVPISNISNILVLDAVLQRQSPIAAPPPQLIGKV